MSAYRPRSRDRDYDSNARQREGAPDQSDPGFQIRGRASRDRRSPPRQYHDLDRPSRRDQASERHYGRRYDVCNYSALRRTDYHANDDYIDASSYYEETEAPPGSNGDQDVAPDERPLQFLLIRGLKTSVTEAMLGKGLEKLYLDQEDKPAQSLPLPPPSHILPGAQAMPTRPSQSGATRGSLKRVFLIKDRVTDRHMTYGFAEYHSISDAKAARNKANELGDTCTISSKPIKVDYPHLGVFPEVPPTDLIKDSQYHFEIKKGSIRRYYDIRYWASSKIVNQESPHQPSEAEPSTQPTQKSLNKRPIAESDSMDGPSIDKPKKLKTGGAPLAMAEMWQKKQAELRGEDIDTSDDNPSNGNSLAGANHDSTTENIAQSFVFEGERNGEHVKCCLLCMTTLSDTVSAEAHVKRSPKHLENMMDDAKYKQGFQNIKKYGVTENDTVVVKQDKAPRSEFRDRAKERRQEEAKMGIANGGKIKLSLKGAQGQKESNKPVAPSYGKGLNMLQKAGWKEGQGLGSGEGATAPIEQSMYAAGVGLGHESSKKGDAVEEAARLTKDDGGSFLEKTKEVARERFERMG